MGGGGTGGTIDSTDWGRPEKVLGSKATLGGGWELGVEEEVMRKPPHPVPLKDPSEDSRQESLDQTRGVSRRARVSAFLVRSLQSDRSLRTFDPESLDPIALETSRNFKRTCMWPDEQVFR